jgi:hypothetical protein
MRYFLLMTTILVTGPASTRARLLEAWPYDKLMKESNLVVIATATKTEAASDKPPDHGWPYEFVAQNTTFKVTHALKGKLKDDPIKVLHFKFGELKKGIDPKNFEDTLIVDGPLLVTFLDKTVVGKINGQKSVKVQPEYMLFLKRLPDGRYEPVSGRVDPALSVREVTPPSDPPASEEESEKKPEYVEITIKLIDDAPKEIGPKSRVDVGQVSGSLIGREFRDVLLTDVEVVSLDRNKKTATLRIKKGDEPMLRRAVKSCSLYIGRHRPDKAVKP